MARSITVAVLFSGEGTNLENLIRRFHEKRFGDRVVRIAALTNRPEAGGIARAEKYGIKPVIVDHREFATREAFDAELVERLEAMQPDLVVMAGFMRILTPLFTSRIEAINLHPSLLPLFKGARAIEESFRSGMKVGGVTVHRVTAELDGGDILAQRCVPIEEGDTLASFEERIHAAEYELLPAVIADLLHLSPSQG
ncbi:phosphoribosylglycinamide formyltransferase [Hydrogenimonas sp. SS33]|uniref:phosphoribosylglycinamide formyltransferase n=1 Tax=Hydrogenimonas leucolamina TaxID=2954236 RepID=UPI00336C1EA8